MAPPTSSLPAEINIATRSLHTHLNRLITTRLPLALPPQTDSPKAYATGLRHFAHVYLTFESLWRNLASQNDEYRNPCLSTLLEDPWISVEDDGSHPTSSEADEDKDKHEDGGPTPNDTEEKHSTSQSHTEELSPTLHTFLSTLLPHSLPRSRPLRADLAFLHALSPIETDVLLSHYPSDAVRRYCEHIRRAVRRRPWVLVAYAWVMYMAIFSGGRWIRGVLGGAGEGFWEAGRADGGKEGMRREVLTGKTRAGRGKAEPAPTPTDADADTNEQAQHQELSFKGLTFLSFPGPHDGEDIKALFKSNLEAGETLLSPSQRADIVDEAKTIFEFSIRLVEELDGIVDAEGGGAVGQADGQGEGEGTGVEVGVEKTSAGTETGMRDLMLPDLLGARPGAEAKQVWIHAPGVAGLAVLISCVSWWALCHSSVFVQ
ncbi:heme oxygenase-like protein [Aulographum hederae CBS 113979]|uniref:Heme oxygenase-like protein n=1 Tax=Aulographum hederae CBS 113979 TaxID=1176131 RepID=A0A6G1GQC6_9PEZI|nr:heme oxygenase-like protein [Aulographum hederae CBS 113979]